MDYQIIFIRYYFILYITFVNIEGTAATTSSGQIRARGIIIRWLIARHLVSPRDITK